MTTNKMIRKYWQGLNNCPGLCSRLAAALVIALTILLPSCTKNTTPGSLTGPRQDYSRLPFVVEDNYTYSLYYQGLQASGYADTLADQAGPFTILVPNNDAMTTASFYYPNYNDHTNYFLQAYDPPLKEYVKYLIIPGKVSLKALPIGDNQPFSTLQGTPVYITKYLRGTDTITTVNGVTVIANAIDIAASNGLLDVITSVPEPQVYPNLWQRMLKDGSLTFFTTAALRAGLQAFFETQGQSFTVLAPSNYGFTQMQGALNQLPDLSTIAAIQQADPSILRNIILYHVMKGIHFTNDFARVDTVSGDTVQLTMYNGGIVKYTNQQFFSQAKTHSISYACPPVSPQCGYGPYGNDTIPAVSSYYLEFQYKAPPVNFSNRPTGNGVLQEIDNVLLP